MTKLIIQIPCYNEEETLGLALAELPTQIDGIDIIERLIINDGSTDNSSEILKKASFINTINLNKNYGKGIAIRYGLLKSKNDKVVIFDGDIELREEDILKLMCLSIAKH